MFITALGGGGPQSEFCTAPLKKTLQKPIAVINAASQIPAKMTPTSGIRTSERHATLGSSPVPNGIGTEGLITSQNTFVAAIPLMQRACFDKST